MRRLTLFVWLVVLSLHGCGSLPENSPYVAPQVRPVQWAQPLASPVLPEERLEGLDNCYRIDARLIRCGQPSAADFAVLAELGVSRVLNLRQYHDDGRLTRDARLSLKRMPMNAAEVTPAQLREAVAYISATNEQTLVHCWHGSDRTGAVVAAYRILEQGWSKADAITEFIHGGYGFHPIYWNLVLSLEQL
ncbi:tyrosine-protein phosphatase [Shewanella cyperi]|uniref:Tyrosine-protein phosphatase n=1 Tax=Shewanella cyperi TaxID=2814292 RepID=A0A974XJS1_9GAMM|nr:tyrosine-protein phosphatase [Shewanella cyperi]QSX29707.1 tyrosine-protein phosphatase [Shewanella cyperi]